MQLTRGDYVSSLWVCQSADSMWTITVYRRICGLWEIVLTWDKMDAEGRAVCKTPIHKIELAEGMSEGIVLAQLEVIVSTLESQKKCKRVGLIDVKSANPQDVIDAVFNAASLDDRLGCLIVVNDPPAA